MRRLEVVEDVDTCLNAQQFLPFKIFSCSVQSSIPRFLFSSHYSVFRVLQDEVDIKLQPRKTRREEACHGRLDMSQAPQETPTNFSLAP